MVVLHAAPCGQRPALRLRPWCEQDIPELIDIYRDRSMRRQARSAIITHDDARQWLEIQRKGWRDGDRLSFAVLEWTAGHDVHPVLGNIVLKGHAPGRASAEVGYWTAPGSRGRGVASGALTAITAWSFQSLDPDGLRYIELLHQATTGICRGGIRRVPAPAAADEPAGRKKLKAGPEDPPSVNALSLSLSRRPVPPMPFYGLATTRRKQLRYIVNTSRPLG